MKKYHVVFEGVTKNYAPRNYQRRVGANSEDEAVEIARKQIDHAAHMGIVEPLRDMKVIQIFQEV